MAEPDKSVARRATTWGGVAAVIAALYFARQVCIPLALAVLISFLLAPLVVRLRHWGLGRVFSVVLAVTGAVAVIGFIAWLMTAQVLDLAAKLPQYQSNMQKKVQSFSKPGGGILGQATRVLHELGSEVAKVGKPAESEDGAGSNPPTKPIPVEMYQTEPSALKLFRTVVASLLGPLATTGIVIVFVIFMLLNREDLRDRLIRLIGPGQINLTTQALDDAAQGVSRFLLTQLMVNLCYGIPIGIGLYFVGVPNPLLWGFMAAVLRFIPYLGPWLGASIPAVLAFAVDPGWGKLAGTLGVFAGMELVTYNVLEPFLYSARTGISAVAILAAAVFWTWLWGPIGLLLSTPLTVCLVVLGRYVPQLEFFYVLLGDEPVLAPHTRFYQRLLAMSYEEASELVDQFIAEHSVRELFDNVMIPALILAEEDRHQGLLDRTRERFVFDSVRELLADLRERQLQEAEAPASGELKNRSPEGEAPASVLCLPASDEADELAGLMLIELLSERGIVGKTVPPAAVDSERLDLFEQEPINIVYISALPPGGVTPAKSLCKRLRKQFPNLKIVIGVWEARADLGRLRQRIGPRLADTIVKTLSQAVEEIAPGAVVMTNEPGDTAAIPSNEQQQLAELKR